MLRDKLNNWDGKSQKEIKAIYCEFCEQNSFIAQLLEALFQPDSQIAASWLIKHHLESGTSFIDEQARSVLDLIHTMQDWQAELHILQSLPYMSLALAQRSPLEAYLRSRISDNNKFVRAWAYNGFYLLARLYPELQNEAHSFLEMAMQDEPASVKARVRQCLKKGF